MRYIKFYIFLICCYPKWDINMVMIQRLTKYCCFLLRMCQVQISAQGLADVTKIYDGFPEFLQENAGIIL